MNIELPDPNTYDGVVLTGYTVTSPGGAETLSGAVIVKAAYDLTGPANTTKAMVRSTERARFAVSFEDAGVKTIDTKNTPATADDVVVMFAYQRDSDIALQKAQVDIAVKGGGGANISGTVKLDGAIWLSRSATAHQTDNDHGLQDILANLFGWHSRAEDERKLNTLINFKPEFPEESGDVPNTLPPEYGPIFNNFFRRGGGFSVTAAGRASALPSGKTVSIVATNTNCTIALPDLAMKAQLRAWCGDCPDKPERWCVEDTIPLAADTLIVDPAANQAEIIWRGRFDWNDAGGEPVNWRLARVMEGAI